MQFDPSTTETVLLPPKRIYLMSMAASGKSTFARDHRFFEGYRVVDFAGRLPQKKPLTKFLLYISRPIPILQRAIKKNKGLVAIHQQYYFDAVIDLMRNHDGPIVVLGRRLPNNFSEIEFLKTVAIGMVIVPEEQHHRNCMARKRKMRNPLPFFNHWTTNFQKVLDVRKTMTDYADRHQITVYDGFTQAIEALQSWQQPVDAEESL